MKRFLALLTILALLVMCFAGCANDATTEGDTTDDATVTDDNADTAGDGNEADDGGETTDAAGDTDSAGGDPGAFDNYPRPKMVDPENVTIAYIISAIGTAEYASRGWHQMQIEVAHRGYEVILCEYNDSAEARDMIQNVINQGVDAIFCSAMNDMETYQDLVIQAREAGIGWYSTDSTLIDGCISNVAVNNAVIGVTMLYYIGQLYNWDCGIVTVQRPGLQQHTERIGAMLGALDAFPNMELISQQFLSTDRSQTQTECYEVGRSMVQAYPEDLDVFITMGDSFAVGVAEGLISAGYTDHSEYVVTGMDGGSMAYRYIRNNTPFAYTAFQPCEQFVHTSMEIFEDIQVEGLNPGDPGCLIDFAGQTIYGESSIIGPTNCPDVGDSIHVGTSYYDPDDPDGWWNWDDGPGIYYVQEGL